MPRFALFFIVVLLIAVCDPSCAQTQNAAREIGAANAEVAKLYHAGKYAEGLQLALKTLERAEKELGPEHPETLERFYRKVRPSRFGWGPIAKATPDVRPDGKLGLSVVAAVLAAGIVYCTLPAVGLLLFGEYTRGILAVTGAAVCALGVGLVLRRIGWKQIVG